MNDYGLSTTQGQLFPGFPGGGGGNVNRRLDRLENQVQRLQNQTDRLDRRVDRIERRLGTGQGRKRLLLLLNHSDNVKRVSS